MRKLIARIYLIAVINQLCKCR